MSYRIDDSDYIKPDVDEELLKPKGNRKRPRNLLQLMEENRGIYINEDGYIESIDPRTFAQYVVKRVDMFRIDTGKSPTRMAKNQATHGYEVISQVTLGKVCMHILDEYCSDVYDLVREPLVFNYIDKHIQSHAKVEVDDRYLLFPNGIYDLEEGTFDDQFDTDACLTYQMGFAYDPDATCKRWKKALRDMFPDDQEAMLAVIQEMFGYTFAYGSAKAGKLFYLYGRGRNGKSLLNTVLRKLHGEENVAGIPLNQLADRFNLSAIYRKRVCICPENSQAKLLDTSTLKALTGRDAIKIEFKYEMPFTDVLKTKIIVSSNHLLQTDDDSTGFWERILAIPFKVIFVAETEDVKGVDKRYTKPRVTDLEDELEEELPGIFNWAVEGLSRLRDNDWKFTYSKSSEDLRDKMLVYSKPVTAFVKEHVTQGNDGSEGGQPDKIKSSEVLSIYRNWARSKMIDIDGLYSGKFRQDFMDSLQKNGIYAYVRKDSVDYYYGILVSKK